MSDDFGNQFMSKSDQEEQILRLAGEVCDLPESEISDCHPKVVQLQDCLERFQRDHGPSVTSQVMRSEFTFEDWERRILLLGEALRLASSCSPSELGYVRKAYRDLRDDLDGVSLKEKGALLFKQLSQKIG